MSVQGTDRGKIAPNLLALQEAWQKHPKFKQRALGGRRALDGFHYQLAVSLDRFFEAVLAQNEEAASVAFEGLSDLSEKRESLVYLTQIKTTLRKESLQDAIQEAIAVDEFLEECCPSVRNSFRFRITARSLRGNVSSQPARLTASELKLDAVSAKRWEHLRHRCLPVEVDGAPEVRLATRLWNDVTHPTTLIDTCMGRLLQMLPSGVSPVQIAKALLALWNTARRQKVAPLHLLGATDLKKDNELVQRHIVHGVRPSLADVRDGCFMDRPEKLKAVLSTIHERWLADAQERNAVVPVFWITGPSGAGKSVLLLQIISELLADGQVEAVNYIESYAHALPRALDNASATSLSMLVAGDDLYSPENRDPAIWREVGELTATARKFPNRFAILTCGPLEQLKAFRRECERHRALDPVEIVAEPLTPEEQVAYHEWYQQRTGVDVPIRREAIFVAAAWIYELHREQRLTPEAFATRFDNRLHELAIQAQGRAALILNLYGLKAPEGLFQGHRAELAQLVGEQVWRLSNPKSGTLAGRFFHPQISRLIYDALVPRGETVRRAEDISVGFDAMLEEGKPADAFLGWLGSRKIGKGRTRGALMLDETMRVEILKALWPCFRRRGPEHEITPRLFAWQQSALSAEVDLNASGIKARIQSWWHDLGEDAPDWGLLFQMVWDMAAQEERLVLLSRGRGWLGVYLEAGTWPWINRRLIRFSPADAVIRDQALAWLSRNTAHQYCARVWLDLCETTQSSQQPSSEQAALVRLALQAIPAQPESAADIPMWTKTAKLNPPVAEFVDAVARKLTKVRNPYQHEKGVEFLLSLVPATELIANTMPALRSNMENFGWPYLWSNLALRCPREARWLSLGRDWLTGRDNEPEWNFVWQKLIDQNFEHATLLPRGRDWLNGRENEPEWTFVWQKLIDQNFEHATLLPRGRDWLDGRENEPEWAFVWQKLIDQNFERATLLPRGRDWLTGRDDEPEWAFVWQKLVDQNFELATLLPRGRDWLTGRDNEPEWAFVWQKLIDQNFELATLLPRGRNWLIGRESQPGSQLVRRGVRR
ncbi:hypothetical protein [Bradyrhizobium sp. SZCCHNS3052]|uniref:hypothetical protein n=1 Tax=Bradyrhizobium sp. SZCCHNS3052 TaxID=3057321 RepID=UPI002916B1F2|nr:hypothetical protein [Bradyrhizobium sp. SZCCHNS3052]